MFGIPEDNVFNSTERQWLDELKKFLAVSENLLAMLLTTRDIDSEVTAKQIWIKASRSVQIQRTDELYKSIIVFAKTKERIFYLLHTLVTWLDWVNGQTDLNLPICKIPTYSKPPLSPYIEEVRHYPGEYRIWVERLDQTLSISDLSAEEQIAQILLSAIVHGGLHHRHLLRAWVAHLDKPLLSADRCVWAELQLINGRKEPLERRIWQLDPLTEILHARLSPEARSYALELTSERTLPWKKLLSALMKRIRVPVMWLPNLSTLISIVNYMMQLKSPLIAGWMRRSFINHALRPHVWARLQGVKGSYEAIISTTTPVTKGSTGEGAEPDGNACNISEPITFQSEWFRELKQLIKDRAEGVFFGKLLAKYPHKTPHPLCQDSCLL